jgi:hypothetical protein
VLSSRLDTVGRFSGGGISADRKVVGELEEDEGVEEAGVVELEDEGEVELEEEGEEDADADAPRLNWREACARAAAEALDIGWLGRGRGGRAGGATTA